MIRNHRLKKSLLLLLMLLLKKTYLTNKIFSLKTPVTKIRIPPEMGFKFVHVHIHIYFIIV